MWGTAEDLRDFAISVGLWAPEQRPIVSELSDRLMEDARQSLGYYPSYEHMYLYDAIVVAAQTLLTSGNAGGEVLKDIIPSVAGRYFGVTGVKTLDQHGDLESEDTGFIGVVRRGDTYEFGYYSFHNGVRDEFTILDSPRQRRWFFSPQA